MTAHEHSFATGTPAAGESVQPIYKLVRTIGLRLLAWTKTCAEYYTAAAMYENLSALSDAELTRRGLSRTTLARDVMAARSEP